MSLEISNDEGERTLRLICRSLLKPFMAESLAIQLERVLHSFTSTEQLSEISNSLNVVAMFRSRGLIPVRLVELCRTLSPSTVQPDAQTLAVCFAACAYPQRAFQMGDTELSLRVETFLKFLPSLLAAEPVTIVATLSGPEVCDLSQADRLALLSDLSAAEGSEAKHERISGAALYLTTCYPELVKRTCNPWRSEARFVRYFRQYLPAPPSYLTREDQSAAGWPDWSNVRAHLAQMLPDEPAECHALAVILEQMAWKEASHWLPRGLVGQHVCEFWEAQWDKLTSGFPYFAFRSRLSWWWRQCLEVYRFSANRQQSLEDFDADAAITKKLGHGEEASDVMLTPELLRVFHEGYRLVRTTFFRRADKKASHPKQLYSPAEENERLRKALDAIWYERLQHQIEAELPAAMIKQISNRFPELSADTINNLSFRVRMRIWAYALARVGQLRNSEILSTRRPSTKMRSGAGEFPLSGQPGVLTVASLARIVPLEQTLLSAFTAHIFLRPRIEPQRPDSWNFQRYVGELWRWLTDETFCDVVHAGATRDGRSDAAIAAALQQTPFVELWRALTALRDEQELVRWLQTEFELEQAAALEVVADLLGDPNLSQCDERALRAWRRALGAEGVHWFVPVWYLTLVEQLDEQELLARLRVDKPEVSAIAKLARALRGARAVAQTACAQYDTPACDSQPRG